MNERNLIIRNWQMHIHSDIIHLNHVTFVHMADITIFSTKFNECDRCNQNMLAIDCRWITFFYECNITFLFRIQNTMHVTQASNAMLTAVLSAVHVGKWWLINALSAINAKFAILQWLRTLQSLYSLQCTFSL